MTIIKSLVMIMKRKTSIIAGIVCLVLALLLLGYPLAGELLAKKYHSDVESQYTAAVDEAEETMLQAECEAAMEYNAMLYSGTVHEAVRPYDELLNVGGIMGTISIPKINVSLPVDHGTEAVTLEHSVGHLIGSSLPVGGENTHAVLTGHSGLATDRMFSDLTQLVEGDMFFFNVLDETLAYEVDQITTVLPGDTTHLQIEDGKDYMTLITCVPFGINSHRLLVRGERTAWTEEVPEVVTTVEQVQSTWLQQYLVGIACGVGVLAIVAIIYLTRRRGR